MVGETFRHVEQSFDEGSADIAEFPAVEPYVRPIVNAFEIQPHTTPGDIGRLVETDPVPPLRATEAFGNGHVVQPVVRIGIDAGIDQCGQHRSRHHRIIPPGSIVCRAEERASLGHDPIGIGHFPTAGQCPGGVIRLFETHFSTGRLVLGTACWGGVSDSGSSDSGCGTTSPKLVGGNGCAVFCASASSAKDSNDRESMASPMFKRMTYCFSGVNT